jgi:hypothetical protein
MRCWPDHMSADEPFYAPHRKPDAPRQLTRSVGASRQSPRVWRSYASGPHLLPPSVQRTRRRDPPQAEEAVDAGAAVDAENAPTAAWKSRPEREIPTSAHSPDLFLQIRRTKNTYDDTRSDLRGFR